MTVGNANFLDFRRAISEKIWSDILLSKMGALTEGELKKASVVLFVLSDGSACECSVPSEPCLILNKRSAKVRQAGDLCCPGGGVSWKTDSLLSAALRLPGLPMRRWRLGGIRKGDYGNAGRVMSLLLATGLREAWEEMRLNPLRFEVLGVLPPQHLVMFDRVIYPIVGWATPQTYTPNWEVDRIVPIRLRDMTTPANYGRFRPTIVSPTGDGLQRLRPVDFPCFIHQASEGREMLWGATYRIALDFLNSVFGFVPPEDSKLPLVHRALDETYLNGSS